MSPAECADVERFWARCGRAELPSPCDLEEVLLFHFSVDIVPLPGLTTATADRWLTCRDRPGMLGPGKRRLHGCFVAFAGNAVIFVEATDPPAERRFTLAHEAAHLLLDYVEPREDVIQFLGQDALAVLDGARPPSVAERVNAVLANCPIGIYVQQLDYDSPRTTRSELRADRFARELLAPREALTAIPDAALESVLVDDFGLPPDQAEIYASQLQTERSPAPSFLDWLRPSPRPATGHDV